MPHTIEVAKFVDPKTEGLENIVKVTEGFVHIIAHIISKDTKVLEELRRL